MLSKPKMFKIAALGCVAALTLGSTTNVANAEFEEKDVELRLSGFAQNDVEFSGLQASVSGSLGYFFSDQFEAGFRQDFNYTDIGANALNGSTAVFANYHFGDAQAQVQPFIGGSLGFAYGDTTQDTFFAGPEVGIKYFFPDTDQWFLFGQAEYQFFFEDGDEAGDNFNDGVFVYRLGLGVVF